MRKTVLLVLALAVAVATAAQPRDWAGFRRYAQQNESLRGQKIDVVFMGNSITENWIGADPEFFARNGFVDRGIGGQTSSEMLVRFRQDVLDLKPRAVVLMAGINDIAGNNGPIELENTFGNIASMCELARCHGIRVVLCSVLPCERLGWRPEVEPAPLVRRLNAMLEKYAADEKIVYVDYYAACDNGRGGLDERFSSDGCHPTLYGYTILEPLVVDGIRRALRGKRDYYVTSTPNE